MDDWKNVYMVEPRNSPGISVGARLECCMHEILPGMQASEQAYIQRRLDEFDWLNTWELTRMQHLQKTFTSNVGMALAFCHRAEFCFDLGPNVLTGSAELDVQYSVPRAAACEASGGDGTSPTVYRSEFKRFMQCRGPCPWREQFVWEQRHAVTCVDDECVRADIQIVELAKKVQSGHVAEHLPVTCLPHLQRKLQLIKTYFVLEFEVCLVRVIENALLEMLYLAYQVKIEMLYTVIPQRLSEAHRQLSRTLYGRSPRGEIDLPHVLQRILYYVVVQGFEDDGPVDEQLLEDTGDFMLSRDLMRRINAMRTSNAHLAVSEVALASKSSSWYCAKCEDKLLFNIRRRSGISLYSEAPAPEARLEWGVFYEDADLPRGGSDAEEVD